MRVSCHGLKRDASRRIAGLRVIDKSEAFYERHPARRWSLKTIQWSCACTVRNLALDAGKHRAKVRRTEEVCERRATRPSGALTFMQMAVRACDDS
jgi:hypothetical protein